MDHRLPCTGVESAPMIKLLLCGATALTLLLLTSGPLAAQEIPTRATLGGQTYQLRVSAWRDFMPTIGRKGGSDLMLIPALVRNQGPGLEGVRFDQVEASSDGQVWKATPDSGGTCRGGPKWPVGASINVKAHYLYQGKSGWIRLATPTGVARTD